MKEILEKITNIIESYNSMSSDNINIVMILDMARNLSCNLFYLETYRSDIFKKYEGQKYILIKETSGRKPMPVNKAENQCNFQYPQMYQIRRFMEGAYKVLDMMRTDISYAKTELTHTNIRG